MASESYYQLTNMINVKNVSYSLLLINNNNFTNLSISGPLVNFHEMRGSFSTPVVIVNNTFNYIHGYISTNVIHIIREVVDRNPEPILYPYDYDLVKMDDPSYRYLTAG